MTNDVTPTPDGLRADMKQLAHEIARQTAWDTALENQPLSDEVVERIERDTFNRLLSEYE